MTGPRLLGPAVAALVLVAAPLAACSSGSGAHPSTSAATSTGAALPGGQGESTATKKPTARGTRRPARTTASKPKTAPTPAGKVRELNQACPYISNQHEAVAEGKAVGRSTVLTTAPKSATRTATPPVGCRFYLAYPDYHVVTEILVKTYPTELTAFNTVARTGGSSAESTPGIGDGAVLYRTKFYKPDGNQDWSCIFAKGKTVVTIHTDELHSSVDARNVAVAIVGKF